jgi:beta-phosphoglucomutase-like phosphatase (HAD superfamily)
VDPSHCAAIEDSHNGILAAKAAGMRVVAVPNQAFPPGEEAIAAADAVMPSLVEVDEVVIAGQQA